MNFYETELPGVLVFEPRVFGDARGQFLETFREDRYREAGIQEQFVQDNMSISMPGVLRGLHCQWPRPQGKLVHCVQGAILDVAVDARVGSPAFGRSVTVELSEQNHKQIYVPPGFLHGFAVLEGPAVVAYKVTDYYLPGSELTVIWSDPDLDIPWPSRDPVLSEKDAAGRRLREFSSEQLPHYSSR